MFSDLSVSDASSRNSIKHYVWLKVVLFMSFLRSIVENNVAACLVILFIFILSIMFHISDHIKKRIK